MKSVLTSFLISVLMLSILNPPALNACTSWMTFSDITENNTNILHKNRDSKIRTIAVFLSPASSPRKWIALGHTNSGINSSGLAGAMNSGEKCIDPPNVKNKKSTPAMLHAILESCDTASQAVDKLKELIKAGDYSHGNAGSIFFFIDRNEGYICETTAKYCSVQRYNNGYAVRANMWLNPDMAKYSRNTINGHLHSTARSFIVLSTINKALDEKGKVSLFDNFALSRHVVMPEKSPLKRSVCGKTTNSAASIEVDRQYPDVLSNMYVTIGPPLHTVYIPIPVCAEKILPAMHNLKWSDAAFKRLDKLELKNPIPAEWEKFEKNSMAQYAKAKSEARKLLDTGKRAEAIKLINSTAEKIWQDAVKLLKI